MNMRAKFLCLISLLLASQDGCFGELRLLQIVFNSGHRLPPERRPYRDPGRLFWQTPQGQLALIGMIQLYRLGQRMRRKYGDFVPHRGNGVPASKMDDAVDMYATERGEPCTSLSRCFMSGFYRPNKDPPPPPSSDLSWQISENSVPSGVENPQVVLKCPKYHEAVSRLYDDSEEGSRIIGQYMNLYQYWSDNSGMDIRNPTDARELYENLQLERSMNVSLPAWADRFWPELKEQSDIHYEWLAKSPDMQKMAAGPLLGLMIQRMDRHISGHDLKKYFVYSGRNGSLAGILALLGSFDGEEPSFGSAVVLELHTFGAVHYVRALYFHSNGAPEVVVLRGCAEYCPFPKFKALMAGKVPVRWQEECGLWDSGAHAPLHPFYGVWLLVLALLFVS